jgi:hypothetical protein
MSDFVYQRPEDALALEPGSELRKSRVYTLSSLRSVDELCLDLPIICLLDERWRYIRTLGEAIFEVLMS